MSGSRRCTSEFFAKSVKHEVKEEHMMSSMTSTVRTETRQTYQQRILAVFVYVQQHLDEELSLEDLARVAWFSPYHFHRIFRGMVGESVSQHVRRLRLERAANRLKRTEQPVVRIALDAGYEAHESFTRAFSEMFGMPPARYRELHQPPVARVHYGEELKFEPVTHASLGGLAVRIEKSPARRVVFVRHVGAYSEVGSAWQKLIGWAMPRGLFGGPESPMIGIVHDDPSITPQQHVRYDACLVVPAERTIEPEGEIGVQEIAAGDSRSPRTEVHMSGWARRTISCSVAGCRAAVARRRPRRGSSDTSTRRTMHRRKTCSLRYTFR
jgi:AraC family transcriptional regulator